MIFLVEVCFMHYLEHIYTKALFFTRNSDLFGCAVFYLSNMVALEASPMA